MLWSQGSRGKGSCLSSLNHPVHVWIRLVSWVSCLRMLVVHNTTPQSEPSATLFLPMYLSRSRSQRSLMVHPAPRRSCGWSLMGRIACLIESDKLEEVMLTRVIMIFMTSWSGKDIIFLDGHGDILTRDPAPNKASIFMSGQVPGSAASAIDLAMERLGWLED